MKRAMTIDEALMKVNSGKFIETNNDMSPAARIAYALKASMINPNEVSMCDSKGDLELF